MCAINDRIDSLIELQQESYSHTKWQVASYLSGVPIPLQLHSLKRRTWSRKLGLWRIGASINASFNILNARTPYLSMKMSLSLQRRVVNGLETLEKSRIKLW